MNKLNKIQKIGVLFNGFLILIVTILFNPFGGIGSKIVPFAGGTATRLENYKSFNAFFHWLDQWDEWWGFVCTILAFCGLWLYLFKDKKESPKY